MAGPLAASSSAGTLDSFSGKGNGYALGVTVDLSSLPSAVKTPLAAAYVNLRNSLPSNLQAALPANFNFVIDQKFIETLAQVGVTSGAQSLIGSGTVDLGKLLGGANSAKATSDGTSHNVTKALKLPTDDLNLVDVSAGVLDATVGAGPNVSSSGLLSSVNASLGALLAQLPSPVASELQGVFTQIQQNAQDVVDTANTSLNAQVSSITNTLESSTDPVLGGLLGDALQGAPVNTTNITNAVTSALTLPNINDILAGNVASITDLHNVAASLKTPGNRVISNASTQLANINVLNLLNVKAIDLASHSEAAGIAGSAKNSSSCKIGEVKLGDSNGVSLDGKNLYVNGTALPTPVANLATITSAVNNVTKALGLSVTLCDAAQQDASADGTAAAQRVSAIRVELAPTAPADVAALGIKAGDPLLKIVIDPTVETSVAARLAAPADTQPTSIPKTGAGALLSVLVGLGLAGTAIFLRRKFA